MEYSTFRKRGINKLFTRPGLYLIGVPGAETHKTQSDAAVLRSGSKSAMNLYSGMTLYKLGLSAASEGVQGRLSDYATALPNGFRIFAIVEKKKIEVRSQEKKIHDWLGSLGLRYNRFGDVGSTVSKTEWGAASLAVFKEKLLADHLASGSRQCPFIWFSQKDGLMLNGPHQGKSLNKLIKAGVLSNRK